MKYITMLELYSNKGRSGLIYKRCAVKLSYCHCIGKQEGT